MTPLILILHHSPKKNVALPYRKIYIHFIVALNMRLDGSEKHQFDQYIFFATTKVSQSIISIK